MWVAAMAVVEFAAMLGQQTGLNLDPACRNLLQSMALLLMADSQPCWASRPGWTL